MGNIIYFIIWIVMTLFWAFVIKDTFIATGCLVPLAFFGGLVIQDCLKVEKPEKVVEEVSEDDTQP